MREDAQPWSVRGVRCHGRMRTLCGDARTDVRGGRLPPDGGCSLWCPASAGCAGGRCLTPVEPTHYAAMMAAPLRPRTRLVAAAVLVSLLVVGTTSAVPHADDCHGEACGISGPHDPDAHQAGPPSSHDAHQHCAVCHWARSFRQSSDARAAIAPPAEHDFRVHAIDDAPLRLFRASQPPLRSPPRPSPTPL